jgi:hypothetical protein
MDCVYRIQEQFRIAIPFHIGGLDPKPTPSIAHRKT